MRSNNLPSNTSKISQDHGNSRWHASSPTLSLADSPTSIRRLPSVVFPVISLLTDKPKCSSKSVSSNWWSFRFTRVKIYHGSLERNKIFLTSRITIDIEITRDIISFFFLTFPFVFPPTIERVETLVEWKTKFFERKTIYRRSSLEMFNCRCGSFKCGIGHEIHGQTQSTRYSDNWFVHRFVPRCLYIDRYKTCSIYFFFFFFFFHAVLLEFLRVTFMHVPAYPG